MTTLAPKFRGLSECAAGVALFLGSCAAPMHADPRVVSSSATVLELPVVRQDALYECGLVALSSLCGYYGVELPEETREELVERAATSQGLSGAELRETFESCGMEVYLFRGTLDEGELGLEHHVEQGRPVLVMTSVNDVNHYSLFVGFDHELGNVVLLDPMRGRVVTPAPVFETAWGRAQHFSLLALPRVESDTLASNTTESRTTL